MILNAVPTQPFNDVGVTMYSTEPEEDALGLLSTWLMRLPLPAVAPVIPPVTVPTVQVNVLGAVALNEILGLPPLQIAAGGVLLTAGIGLTVTVIVYGAPGHVVLAVDVGVTIYCTVPAVALLGLFNVCAIVAPLPAVAPVMPPVIVPTVQVKVLPAVEVSAIFVAAPLQIVALLAVVTAGVGLTVTVIV
jgi:hypothetical protein